MFGQILKEAVDKLDGDIGWLFLVGMREGVLRCEASYQTARDLTGLEVPLGEGIAGQVARTSLPLRIDDYNAWEDDGRAFETEDLASVIAAPILWDEATRGVILVGRDSTQGKFTDPDLDHLTSIAGQVALVVEREEFEAKAAQCSLQLAQLNDLTRVLLEAEDLQMITDILAERMSQLIDSDGVYIVLMEDGTQVVDSAFASIAIPTGPVNTPPSESFIEGFEAVLQCDEPLSVEDTQNSPYLDRDEAQEFQFASFISVPITIGRRKLGVALLFYQNHHAISQEELILSELIVSSVALAVTRSQVSAQEERRSFVLEALREASVRLTSSLELELILDAILRQALEIVKGDDAHIFLYDEGELSFAAARWADGRQSAPFSEPREEGITYSVARSGDRIVSSSVDSDPLFDEYQWGGAIVSNPLRIGEQVVGVMNVAFEHPHEFNANELRVLELFALQAAIALQNARLFENINTDRRRLELLYEVTSALVSELDDAIILQRAIDLITTGLHGFAGEAFLSEYGTGHLRLAAVSNLPHHRMPELERKLDFAPGVGLEGWVAEHKKAALVPDVKQDERWKEIEGLSDEIQSALCSPIVVSGAVLGVLTVLSKAKVTLEQLDLLVAVSKQVGLALSNARKYRQVERRLAELSALQQVAQVINSRLEMQSLLEEVVEQVRQVLGYSIVEIYLVEGDKLVLRSAQGADDHGAITLPLSQGVTGRVARTNRAAYVPDVAKDPDYVDGISETRSEIAVPLRKGNIVIGVLNVESTDPFGLDEDDLRLLMLLADQVSVAIENASLYDHLMKHSDELEQTVEERTAALAEAFEQARDAERLKTRFVADVSHELRTPLANIRLYLELLSFGNPDRFQEYVQTLIRETDRLVILIEDLLAISRLDAEAVAPHLRPTDLNYLAQGLVNDRQRLLAERSLEVVLEKYADLPLVQADEDMLSQAIANLVTNAMNYTKAGGTITIQTEIGQSEGEEWVILSVKDDGIGIPPEEHDRVFDRFFRGNASRLMPVPGTGLGLAISKEIVERHGGRIALESQIDEGSKFTIWLPTQEIVTDQLDEV